MPNGDRNIGAGIDPRLSDPQVRRDRAERSPLSPPPPTAQLALDTLQESGITLSGQPRTGPQVSVDDFGVRPSPAAQGHLMNMLNRFMPQAAAGHEPGLFPRPRPVQVGTVQGRVIGTQPIFAGAGARFPFDVREMRRRALATAAAQQESERKKRREEFGFEPIKTKQFSDELNERMLNVMQAKTEKWIDQLGHDKFLEMAGNGDIVKPNEVSRDIWETYNRFDEMGGRIDKVYTASKELQDLVDDPDHYVPRPVRDLARKVLSGVDDMEALALNPEESEQWLELEAKLSAAPDIVGQIKSITEGWKADIIDARMEAMSEDTPGAWRKFKETKEDILSKDRAQRAARRIMEDTTMGDVYSEYVGEEELTNWILDDFGNFGKTETQEEVIKKDAAKMSFIRSAQEKDELVYNHIWSEANRHFADWKTLAQTPPQATANYEQTVVEPLAERIGNDLGITPKTISTIGKGRVMGWFVGGEKWTPESKRNAILSRKEDRVFMMDEGSVKPLRRYIEDHYPDQAEEMKEALDAARGEVKGQAFKEYALLGDGHKLLRFNKGANTAHDIQNPELLRIEEFDFRVREMFEEGLIGENQLEILRPLEDDDHPAFIHHGRYSEETNRQLWHGEQSKWVEQQQGAVQDEPTGREKEDVF